MKQSLNARWTVNRISKEICCLILLSWVTFLASAKDLKLVAEPFPPYVGDVDVDGAPYSAEPFSDVLIAVCKKLVIQCSLEVYPWRRSIQMVNNGEADGIFPVARTRERERVFFFSEPLVTSASSFFVRDNSNFKFSKPSDLDGYTVAVYGPSAGSSIVEEILKSGSTGKEIIEVSNVRVLRKLSYGRYGEPNQGLAVVNRDVGLYLIKTENLSGIKYAGDIKKVPLMIAFSRKQVSEEQFHEFNNALKELIRNGSVDAILKKNRVKHAQ